MHNWRVFLYEQWDKKRSKRLVQHIATDKKVFEDVFTAFCTQDGHIAHRSGFILANVFRENSELLIPRIDGFLRRMPTPPHEWYRWHVLWYLSHCKYPPEYDGLTATYAFEELGKSGGRPSIKNATMRLLEFICKRNTELIPEFKLYLENIIENERPTLKCKAEKQMKTLRKWEVKSTQP